MFGFSRLIRGDFVSPSPRSDSPHMLRALDCVFSQLGGDTHSVPPPVEAPEPAGPAESAGVAPPPKVETQADLQTAYEWLLRERKRLDSYTNAQIARLQQEHSEMLKRHYLNEQALIVRSQEVTNKEDFLTRQNRSLQQQAQQLAQRETALAGQREQLCKANLEIAALQEASEGVRRETDQQHGLLETLRAETAALGQDRQKAREDLEALEQQLQQQRVARAKEEELLAARQAQLEQRFTALTRDENAVQRRLAELDDLEARLCQEIEEQEKQLANERRTLEAQAAQLRQQTRVATGGREFRARLSSISENERGLSCKPKDGPLRYSHRGRRPDCSVEPEDQ
jgi:DNA repair exonuclease SbcCD ATPase subunit